MSEGTGTESGREQLERQFDDAMHEIYERAGKEVGYWATRYLQMLRRRGGLETARRLLNAEATSVGYEALRSAGRLDLTVEAYALEPRFRVLFTAEELDRARRRLDHYVGLAKNELKAAEARNPELIELLEAVSAAAPDRRIDFRDGVAAHGPAAIPIIEAWVGRGGSVGFACSVLETIGRSGDQAEAARALRRLGVSFPEWAAIAAAAAGRVEAGKQG